jgi:nucleoside-diphosphate-sugar epimerase
MKVVITGASGFIGGHLAKGFLAQQAYVVGIARRKPDGFELSSYVPAQLNQDLDDTTFRGADLVVHAAHDMSEGALQTNVDGTCKWFERAARAGTAGQIFLSSYSAHSHGPSEYAHTKYLLEQYFIARGGITVRPGLVIGNGGLFAQIVADLVRLPIIPVVGGNRLKVAITDIETLVTAILRFDRMKSGNIYNLFQSEKVGLQELAMTIKTHCRARGHVVPVPLAIAKPLLRAAAVWQPSLCRYCSGLVALEGSQTFTYSSSYDELGLHSRSLRNLISGCAGLAQ